jgi:hypothetical protein
VVKKLVVDSKRNMNSNIPCLTEACREFVEGLCNAKKVIDLSPLLFIKLELGMPMLITILVEEWAETLCTSKHQKC